MKTLFSNDKLAEIRELMRDVLDLKLEDEAVYDAAIAIVRFVCAKERIPHVKNFTQEEKNGNNNINQ